MKKQTAIIPKRTNPERIVHPAGLGLCEHCQILLTMEDMPSESMDAEWRCPKCNGILTSKTFGYEELDKEKWERTRWVGKDGKWTNEKPREDFDLGHWHVSEKLPIF